MKITTEKAFDLLPYALDIYEKINADKIIKQFKDKYKGKKADVMMVGLEVFKVVLSNMPKVKKEVFEIVALVEEKTVEEVKKQPLMQTLKTFKAIFSEPELMGFFKSAM